MKRLEDNLPEQKYLRAKERVEQIKRFYKHLTFYILVNAFFIVRRIYRDVSHGDGIFEALTDMYNYRLFFWWGVVLVFHAISTFKFPNLFGKDWEEKKIREFMNESSNYGKR